MKNKKVYITPPPPKKITLLPMHSRPYMIMNA